MNKVLVTGSSGFIGKHLMKALGDRGIGFDIKKGSGYNQDITDPYSISYWIKRYKPELLINIESKE